MSSMVVSSFDPADWTADVVLVDGSTVAVRLVDPHTDVSALEAFHARQSSESVYFRFFTAMPRLQDRMVESLLAIDFPDHVGLGAFRGDDMIALARYDRLAREQHADVAFSVDDAHHGCGLATVLLEHLAAVARSGGLDGFRATVLPSNRKMLGVFHAAGFGVASEFDDGVVDVSLDIASTEAAQQASEERERLAEAASVRRMLEAGSVAVVGAGRSDESLGHRILANLLAQEFAGPIYPVNANASEVLGCPTWPRIRDIREDVDLAVVAVPAKDVIDVVAECAASGVETVVVASAGFAEAGPEGIERERLLVETVRRNGLRLLGPTSLGVMNTAPDRRLVAAALETTPRPGAIALLSQSGIVADALLERAENRGMGLSSFVAVGNKADISVNDLLQYWEVDERTAVILLYVESFGNPRKFARIARRVSRRKPIVTVGVTPRLNLPTNDPDWPIDATADALLAQAGVIRVGDLNELLDVGRMLDSQPLPGGPNVVILTNSTSVGTLTLGACLGHGLVPAELSAESRAALDPVMHDGMAVGNPVDLSYRAGPVEYELALETVLRDDEVDAVVVAHVPPDPSARALVTPVVSTVARRHDKLVCAISLRRPEDRAAEEVPVFVFPEDAARALGRVTSYAAWRREMTEPPVPAPDWVRQRRQQLAAFIRSDEAVDLTLGVEDALALAADAGLSVARTAFVHTEDAAVSAAESFGSTVVLKAGGVDRMAPAEAAGIALDLHDAEAIRSSYRRMSEQFEDDLHPAWVQEMVGPGVPVSVVLRQGRDIPPVVTFGLGGVAGRGGAGAVSLLAPVDRSVATEVVTGSSLGATLEDDAAIGHVAAVVETVSLLAIACPEIAELRLNPLLVDAAGAVVVNVAARVRRDTDPAFGTRRL